MLGPVKPWVKAAADEVGDKFDINTMYGVGVRPNVSDHPLGLAIDFMVYGDKGKGDQLAAYVIANAQRLSVKYVIWYQRIWQNGSWKAMADRGGVTANHRDHVHVSFNNSAGSGGSAVPAIDIPNPFSGIQDQINSIWQVMKSIDAAMQWLADPHNWMRIGAALGGGVLILIALLSWDKVKAAPAVAAQATKAVTSNAN